MLIAVVGGKLQGIEAAYLARKAGWKIRLIDRRPDVPAGGLCDEFLAADVCDEKDLDRAFRRVDLILPALEDPSALQSLAGYAERSGTPLAFDPAAYGISSSKILSGRLFDSLGLPVPKPWPGCRFPVIAKPSRGSGSRGVQVARNEQELDQLFPQRYCPDDWVFQEFLEGPSFSIEVIGHPGSHRALQVTDLFIDSQLDCMRVEAPTGLPPDRVREFEELAMRLADGLQLKGLMDVEVILNDGILKVLEIDARLPSQTPTAVFWSCGFNMVEALAEVLLGRSVPRIDDRPVKAVVYQHVLATGQRLISRGEHLVAAAGPLHLHSDFFGADEALSDYKPGRAEWRATLITAAADRDAVRAKHRRVIDNIRRRLRCELDCDAGPGRRGAVSQ
jgi:pyrrolysine biosynthesis protein PylC